MLWVKAMNETIELLRAWAEHGSEDAFAQLVARHIDLVHSVALRKVAGDTGLAADITQTVFTDLARKARTLRAEGSLAGWLHRHTCLTAATAMRGELRRRAREQTAAAMHALENSSDDPNWSRLAPLLDDAVNALGDTGRRAVLLRFYERRNLRDVGAVLGVGEDAAQKRVSRALDELRDWLATRGVTSTTAALATAIGAHGVTAAPTGLAATITSTALVATAAKAAGAGTLTLLELMTHTKAKLAVGTAIAAVIATPMVWQENTIATIHAENRTLAAQIEPLESLRAEQARLTQQRKAQDETARVAREREELERLRGETASLRSQLQQARSAKLAAPKKAVASASDRSAVPANNVVMLADARDVGAATGETLVQTMFWAMRTVNTNRVFQLGDWSVEGARASAEKMFREMAQTAATGELERSSKDVAFVVRRQIPLDDGDAVIVMDMGKGTETNRTAYRIRRAGNEWRVVMGKNGPQEVKLREEFMQD